MAQRGGKWSIAWLRPGLRMPRTLGCVTGHIVRLVNLTTGIEEAHAEFLERSTTPSVAAVSPGSKELLVKTIGASSNSTSPQLDYWTLDVARSKWTFIGPASPLYLRLPLACFWLRRALLLPWAPARVGIADPRCRSRNACADPRHRRHGQQRRADLYAR